MRTDLDRLKRDLAELQKLQGSRGWQLVVESLRADVMNAALALGDNPNMPEAEMHFRRGAIYAARNYTTVLDLLVQQAENAVVMASAEQSTPLNPDALA